MSNLGLAAYGLLHPNFPVAATMTVLSQMKVPKLSILWNTFGENYDGLKRFLALEQMKVLQIQAINEVGHRNRVLGKYEVLYGLGVEEYNTKLIRKGPKLIYNLNIYFQKIADVLNSCPSTPYVLYVSPGLESNLSPEAFKVLAEIVAVHLPKARIVYNPNHDNKFNNKPLKNYVFESHKLGYSTAGAFIVNNDGADVAFIPGLISDPNQISVETLKANIAKSSLAKINFLWSMRMNGRIPGPFVDPRKRKDWPTRAELAAISNFLT